MSQNPLEGLTNLAKKPMNRKEFFVHFGVGVIGILGAGNLITSLMNYPKPGEKTSGTAYNSGRYNPL